MAFADPELSRLSLTEAGLLAAALLGAITAAHRMDHTKSTSMAAMADLRGPALAVAVSSGAIAVLAHGIFNAGSVFTGTLMAGSTIALVLLGDTRSMRLCSTDIFFVAFVIFIMASLAINGHHSDRKEIALLALTLASYPAGRSLAGGRLPRGFITTGAIVVAAGVACTVPALIEQWNGKHGKPLVFGVFDAAGTQFSATLAIVLFSVVSIDLTRSRTALTAALSAIPVAVFSASLVRYSFLALAATLGASIALRKKQRSQTAAILLTVIVVALVGSGVRHFTWTAEAKVFEPLFDPRCPSVNIKSSISIRKQLYADAVSELPRAGALGIGLDSFPDRSCPKGHQVHNSLLQTAVEFGWLAGLALAAMIVAALWRPLLSLARETAEGHFVFCTLLFLVLTSMVHGRISRDAPLLLFLGYASSVGLLTHRAGSNADPDDIHPPLRKIEDM